MSNSHLQCLFQRLPVLYATPSSRLAGRAKPFHPPTLGTCPTSHIASLLLCTRPHLTHHHVANRAAFSSARTPLHKALYLGHLSTAALLLRAGASLEITDHKGRQPADLISSELRQRLGPWTGKLLQENRPASSGAAAAAVAAAARSGSAPAEDAPQRRQQVGGSVEHSAVFAWGSGANWQLGVGSQELHLAPVRVDHGLSGELVTSVSASKFHSASVTGGGRAWVWGWARGGRLGIDDALLARVGSRGAAQIVPRALDGLGRRQVVAIAAAKHHTLAATASGELWSWGSNRWGALGYPAVDTQPTPKRCVSFVWFMSKWRRTLQHAFMMALCGSWTCSWFLPVCKAAAGGHGRMQPSKPLAVC